MKIKRKGRFLNFMVAVIFILGCCGLGFSFNNNLNSKKDFQKLSSNDSIISYIIEILNEGKGLNEEKKKEIVDKINSFPGRIIRRDTSTFYLQTVLEIAFHEFVSEDLNSLEKAALNFTTNLQEKNPFSIPIKYGLIKFATFRLKDKTENDKSNSKILFESSEEYKHTTEVTRFMVDFFPDLPLDLHINSYINLFNTYKEFEGVFVTLEKGLINKSLIERCEQSDRPDILYYFYLISGLKKVDEETSTTSEGNGNENFENDKPGFLTEDSINLNFQKNLKELALQLYDIQGNISMIDSLIAVGQNDSIGKYMDNFQNLNIQRGNLIELIDKSKKYEKFIPEKWKSRFYGYVGVANMSLGRYEEAKSAFSRSFNIKENKNKFSGSVLNYATTMAEQGNLEDAIKLFKTQEDKVTSIKDSYHYWDGLGYLYSFIDSKKALIYYNKADSVLEANEGKNFNGNFFLSWPENNGTRHFLRKCKVLQNDLYQWKNALKQAGLTSGEDSYFNFYRSLPNGLYHSELGRYKNLLFDFEGASKDFERAQIIFENLDSADYRIKWFNECWQDLKHFNSTYGSDTETALEILQSNRFSPLHKIWIIGDLVTNYDSIDRNNHIDVTFFNDQLSQNFAESLLALSNSESRYLPQAIHKIQELLMTEKTLCEETSGLAALNLLRKGILQTSSIELEKKLLNSTGSSKKEHSELLKLRKELNHAYAYEDSLKIMKLLPLIANKESDLYYSLKDSINLSGFLATDPDLIKDLLGENDLAIDFIEFLKNDTTETGAFIYFPNGEIHFEEVSTYSDEKRENFWKNLLPFMNDKENIYFSPDGNLIYQGIEFYPGENGEPLFQSHRLHRVSHLRNIRKDDTKIKGEIAVVGVSDHNTPISATTDIYRGNWTDLPEVEYEVKLIDNILENYPHRVFYNDAAVEENVKELDGDDLAVIHFSTHGLYRNADSLLNAVSDTNHFDHNIARRTLKTDRRDINGIVLRKGNLTWQLPHLLDDEDDILTAEEIEVMNFPNLQLTVLSACDSGLGEINPEGAQGLQRALRIAGSKNIICSLNKVDDYWSSLFMGELYKNLIDGMSIYDSFRNAQMNIKLAAPENPVAWSSYILIE